DHPPTATRAVQNLGRSHSSDCVSRLGELDAIRSHCEVKGPPWAFAVDVCVMFLRLYELYLLILQMFGFRENRALRAGLHQWNRFYAQKPGPMVLVRRQSPLRSAQGSQPSKRLSTVKPECSLPN